jgi:hypothetical protein
VKEAFAAAPVNPTQVHGRAATTSLAQSPRSASRLLCANGVPVTLTLEHGGNLLQRPEWSLYGIDGAISFVETVVELLVRIGVDRTLVFDRATRSKAGSMTVHPSVYFAPTALVSRVDSLLRNLCSTASTSSRRSSTSMGASGRGAGASGQRVPPWGARELQRRRSNRVRNERNGEGGVGMSSTAAEVRMCSCDVYVSADAFEGVILRGWVEARVQAREELVDLALATRGVRS